MKDLDYDWTEGHALAVAKLPDLLAQAAQRVLQLDGWRKNARGNVVKGLIGAL